MWNVIYQRRDGRKTVSRISCASPFLRSSDETIICQNLVQMDKSLGGLNTTLCSYARQLVSGSGVRSDKKSDTTYWCD